MHVMSNITINVVEWSSNNNNNVNTTIIIIIVVVVFLLAFARGFLIGRNCDAEGRRVKEVHSAESQRRMKGLLMGVRSGAASGTRRRSTPMTMFHMKESQTPL